MYLPQSSKSFTSIGNGAFGNCISLTSVVIPKTVNRIGANAFRNCRTLQKAFMGSTYYRAGDDGDGDLNTYDDFIDFLKHRFDDLPLHYDCYRYPNFPTGESISGNGSNSNGGNSNGGNVDRSVVVKKGKGKQSHKNMSSHQRLKAIILSYMNPFGAFSVQFVSKDGFEMTPLHVLACNPNADMGAIKVLIDALAPCHKVIESTKMKSINLHSHGAFGASRNEQQQQQQFQSYSPLQLYLKSRGLSYVPLIKALKQGMPWSFIEELISMQQSSLEEIQKVDDGKGSGQDYTARSGADSTTSTKGLYPFMISAAQRNCDFETTYHLALASVEVFLRKN